MACTVVFSAQSDRDLERIVRFLAQKNPPAAERLGHALIDRALALNSMPRRGVEVPTRPGIRRLVHRPCFVIYYRVNDAETLVEILRFWDARQNPEGLRLP